MNKNVKGEWVRSSSTPSREERLREHAAFEESQLKKMLDNGYQVTAVEKKPKRPRIKRQIESPKRVKITISGWESLGTMVVTFEDYNTNFKTCCKIVAEFF